MEKHENNSAPIISVDRTGSRVSDTSGFSPYEITSDEGNLIVAA